MAITYGFFNSVDGDRKYNAEQMSKYFKGLVSDGVYESVTGKMQVKLISGMQVGVQKGRALVDCKWIENDAVYPITINDAHALLNRYTAIVIRCNNIDRTIDIIAVDGEPASVPLYPDLVGGTDVKDLCLAMIYVKAGATSIAQQYIFDMRGSSLCPWVTGLVQQVDTSELFLQYQTAYEEQLAAMQSWQESMQTKFENWMETLTDQLQVNTYIQEYKETLSVGVDTTYVIVPISQYEYGVDILDININGVMLVEREDYTLSKVGGSVRVDFTFGIKGENTLEFRVLKSKIGVA